MCLVGFLALTGCGLKSTPPAPQSVVSQGPDVAFWFLRWNEGLNLLLVDDIHLGRHETKGSGSSNNPVHTESGMASSRDGRSYTWQLETTDGRTAKFSIDGKEYDLSKGALVVVRTKGETVQVLQLNRDLARDLAGVLDADGCRDYLKQDGEVMKFLEVGDAPK